MLTFPTFKPRRCSQESLWLNTNFPFHFSQHVSYFRNDRNNILVRVLHASCRDNPHILLTYTINVCFWRMQSLISWSGSSSSSHYSGSQAVSILLYRVGATELLWHNPTNRGEQTLSLSLNGLAQQWHTSLLPAGVWSYLMQEGLGNVTPGSGWSAASQQ